MNIKRTTDEVLITWRMWVVVFSTAFGIYVGGVVSGYFIARAEYSQKAMARDAAVSELKKQVDQVPARTAEAVKEDDVK